MGADQKNKSAELRPVFSRLREILQQHAAKFQVGRDKPGHYSLDAAIGPATLQAWGGKVKNPTIPVAWVQQGKACVSYHLMGVYGNPKLLESCSEQLRARMQGKACFNFKTLDEAVVEELERLTLQSLRGMRKAGYIA